MSLQRNWATSMYLVLRSLGFLCWPNLTDHLTDLLRRIEPEAIASIEVQARTDSNSRPVALPGTSAGAGDDFQLRVDFILMKDRPDRRLTDRSSVSAHSFWTVRMVRDI